MAKSILSIASTIDNNNLSRSLCHLDYVNKNIIFDETEHIWTIDFDKCKIDYSVHDISYFMRRFLKRDNTNWNVDLAINCLNLYEKSHPLNSDEYKYILAYVGFPQKYWKISRDYYKNIKKCNKNAFTILLEKSVKNDMNQSKFIQLFTKYIEDRFNTIIH